MNDKNPTIPGKSFFRIGEVSRILGVEPHVVRFWESEFRSVKPIRSKSDQRIYRRKDLETLLNIKKLLYEEKFTIEGARRQLTLARPKKNQPAPDDQDVSDRRLRELKRDLIAIRKIIS